MARSAENIFGGDVAGKGAGGRLANRTRPAQTSSSATAVSNAERRGGMIINVQPVGYQGCKNFVAKATQQPASVSTAGQA
jgi:hypothetical protein